ncbi:MAG: hypothetical protein Q9163_001375 [Psora crenata]
MNLSKSVRKVRLANSGTKGDATGGSRGRPRIDAQDQSATERRRTQIRLAQRAYRARKESTIAFLNKKVAALEAAMADMNLTFHEFEQMATQSGSLEAGLADELRRTSDCLAEQARHVARKSLEPGAANATPPANSSVNVLDARTVPHIPRRRTRQSFLALEPEPEPPWGYGMDWEPAGGDGHETTQLDLSQAGGQPAADWNAPGSTQNDWLSTEAFSSWEANPQPQFLEATETTREVQQMLESDRSTTDNLGKETFDSQTWEHSRHDSQYDGTQTPNLPAPSLVQAALPDELPLPTSHSYGETSFTRRLMRASIETTCQLLLQPNPAPAELDRLTSLAFCLVQRPTYLQNFQHLLQRTTKDNLELWQAPLLHVGGSGLHYPRGGIDASSNPPGWWANSVPPGPLLPRSPERPLPAHLSDDEIIEYAGVGGEWFDSNDVEQYLHSKGLPLESHSSVVEMMEPRDDAIVLDVPPQPQWNFAQPGSVDDGGCFGGHLFDPSSLDPKLFWSVSNSPRKTKTRTKKVVDVDMLVNRKPLHKIPTPIIGAE